MAKKKITKRKSVERNRNGGKWSESEYWGKLRSAIRNAYKYWHPMTIALNNASRPSKNPKLKKEYQCATCKEWFKRTDVQIDHIIPCGSLKCFEDIEGFITRMTTEDPNDFQILCKPHHKEKTYEERFGKK
jgi:5-methylcytosine-specific restriction endonuclease McrA